MPRIDPEVARQKLIDEVAKAIYPVLIPMEQQCYQIQAENAKLIRECATEAVNYFLHFGT